MLDASAELPKEIASTQMQSRGFVGVYMNLGPKVRKMSGWAAGAFAGGYVGWYAVENGIRRISLGRNIAGWSMSFNVNIP